MRSFLKFLLLLGIVGGLGYGAYVRVIDFLKERSKPEFATKEVVRGDIRVEVQASGEIKPVLEVMVGSFVSGPIINLPVEFNDEVKVGQLLAEIDPRIYQARYSGDLAALASSEANVWRVKAELQRAENDLRRANELRADNPRYISQAELDQLKFARDSLKAQLNVSDASVKQAEANLENSKANLDYTKITAPVDGIIIDRRIDPGQTLAAQFQAPELFVIAPDMREKMHIEASVSEGDIWKIRESRDAGHPVHFTVDADLRRTFDSGVIEEIRLSSDDEEATVVTYPVIVSTPNPDLELLPRMTAHLKFLVSEKKDVLKVPRKALQFSPEKVEYVHPDDQSKLDITAIVERSESQDESNDPSDEFEERHVWILGPDGLLRAVTIFTGVEDMNFVEVVSGDLKTGDQVVTEQVEKSYDSW